MTNSPLSPSRRFFIAGESYAGIYIPTLANIVAANASINLKVRVRMPAAAAATARAPRGGRSLGLCCRHSAAAQGVAVGNGCIGADIGGCSNDGNRVFLEQLANLGFYSPEVAAVMPTVCENYATPTAACLALQVCARIG